ncbi:MAG TPA: hypothetical protein VFS64_03645 [Solirubrobacterales bacterium]|nr:hypothetical protein [Solirubrobacterales bacterium]
MTVTARHAWTDERLDDLKRGMDQRFNEVDKRLDRVDADLREVRGTLDSVQRTMVHGFIAMSGIMATGFLTLAGLQVF